MPSVAVAMGCGRKRGSGGQGIGERGKVEALKNDGLLVSTRS